MNKNIRTISSITKQLLPIFPENIKLNNKINKQKQKNISISCDASTVNMAYLMLFCYFGNHSQILSV